MNIFNIPKEKKMRVIINTDAKNEVDDQYAIVQTLLTESFDIRGLIAAHFGDEKSDQSMIDSYDEIMKILGLMDIKSGIRVEKGAPKALTSELEAIESDGARLIIEEALKADERPLYIAFLGPLTDMASALLLAPEIQEKDIKVIWIGGRDWPDGGWEYNLKNDVNAANVVFKSEVELWQVPRNVYRMMPVSFSELNERVKPNGAIGEYLVDSVVEFNNATIKRPTEYRILGDSPAIGLIMYEDCGKWSNKSAPTIDSDMKYVHHDHSRKIRVYENIDARFIMEDLYAKLSGFHKSNPS
jgi:inosine-uridine nucleoside N-ribohydrolase